MNGHAASRVSPMPVCRTSMLCPWNVCAAYMECLCSVHGTSVLRQRKISLLYADYPGSNLWTLRILRYILARQPTSLDANRSHREEDLLTMSILLANRSCLNSRRRQLNSFNNTLSNVIYKGRYRTRRKASCRIWKLVHKQFNHGTQQKKKAKHSQ